LLVVTERGEERMIESVRAQNPVMEGLFDRVVRAHLEVYCLILALLTLTGIALLH
jgi:hypothetical protein